jgi:hypothetical protein
MNKTLNKLKVLLGIAKNQFGKIASDKAEIFYDGEELKVETRVYDAEGNAIPDGEYSDGSKVYVIADSVVTEIRPVEEEEVEEEKTETTTTTETTEEKTEEMAENDIVEETTEEIVEETIAPEAPSMEERVAALEKVVEELYEEIREMKVREVESVAKNEEIIREFSAMRSTPSAKSVTSGNSETKEFACDGKRKLEKLKELKAKKQQ